MGVEVEGFKFWADVSRSITFFCLSSCTIKCHYKGKKMPLAAADLRVRGTGSKPELSQKLEAYGSLDTTDPQA